MHFFNPQSSNQAHSPSLPDLEKEQTSHIDSQSETISQFGRSSSEISREEEYTQYQHGSLNSDKKNACHSNKHNWSNDIHYKIFSNRKALTDETISCCKSSNSSRQQIEDTSDIGTKDIEANNIEADENDNHSSKEKGSFMKKVFRSHRPFNLFLGETEIPRIFYPLRQVSAYIPVISYGFTHLPRHDHLLRLYQSSKANTDKNVELHEHVKTQFIQAKIINENEVKSPTLKDGESGIQEYSASHPEQTKEEMRENDLIYEQNSLLLFRYITDPRFHIVFDSIHDPEYPRNWDLKKKMTGTMLNSCACMVAQLGSGIIAPLATDISQEFNVTSIWASLASTIYFIGMAFGPILFAPLSEIRGRKVPIVSAMAIGCLVTILAGYSQSFITLLLCRFFWGLAASSPIVIAGSSISDLWYPGQRATYLAINSLSIILGPTTSYLVGTGLKSLMSWRWVIWINAIASFVLMICIFCFYNESYHPILLQRKAKRMRQATGNWLYHCDHDSLTLTKEEMLRVHLLRPVFLLFTPIVLIVCLFNGFSFGLYFMVSIYVPKSFQNISGWTSLTSSIPPLSIFVGAIVGAIFHLTIGTLRRRRIQNLDNECAPETRLYVPLVLGWLMPMGMMLYGWGVEMQTCWIIPCIGLALIGAGFFVILQGSLNYLCDAFPTYSASCIAANTFTRSMFACTLPLVSPTMFKKLGLGWGSTILAFIGFTMTLFVFYIYRYGNRIRAKGALINV